MYSMPDLEHDICEMDNLDELCSEFDKPNDTANTATNRNTPIKRNALASKQKGTVRKKRNTTPSNATRLKSIVDEQQQPIQSIQHVPKVKDAHTQNLLSSRGGSKIN